MPAAALSPQASLYETTIENASLEEALEEREKIKDKRRAINKSYRERHEKVKVLVDEADIADGPVRVGRFVITRKKVPGRPVEFVTSDSEKLQISLIPDVA